MNSAFWNKDPESTVDCSFRADLALANGRLVGFEIKSQKDSLKRWTSQMMAYNNVLMKYGFVAMASIYIAL